MVGRKGSKFTANTRAVPAQSASWPEHLARTSVLVVVLTGARDRGGASDQSQGELRQT